MISFIVPVYNVEKYLARCIVSILSQSVIDFEVLLIDDGSTDSSGRICDEYAVKDYRVKVFHKDNGGVSKARNLGLEHAQGQWIAFVDSDDWLSPDYCTNLMLESGDSDLVFFGCIHENEGGNSEKHCPTSSINTSREEIERTIFYLKNNPERYEYFGYTWNKLFRTSIIRNHGIRFIEKLSLREDELFTADYCRYIHSLKVIDMPIYHYRAGLSSGLTYRTKSEQEYTLYTDYLQATLPYYSLQPLKDYECSRIIAFRVLAFVNAKSFLGKWQIVQSVSAFRHKAPYRNLSTKAKLLTSSYSPLTMVKFVAYGCIFHCKRTCYKYIEKLKRIYKGKFKI